MLLWLSLSLAVVSGFLSPFARRLHATGLWAGKAMVPPEMSDALPQGMQNALTDGWPSWFALISNLLPLAAAVVGFFYAWWLGPLSFILALAIGGVLSRTKIAPPYIERYLAILLEHAHRREAKFRERQDTERIAAIQQLWGELQQLFVIYAGTRVPAPDITTAQSAPHGDPEYLLHEST